MTFRFLPQVFIEFLGVTLAAGAGYMAWRRCNARGGMVLTLCMAAVVVWTLAAGIEAAVVAQPTKIFWSQVEYLGYVNAAPCLFLFVLLYTHRIERISCRLWATLWIIPLITLLLVWTNAWHGLIWTGFSPGSVSENVLIYHHGIGFYVFAGYYYALFFAIIYLLVREYRAAQQPYRIQTGTMILATFFPAIAGFLYIFDLNPFKGLELATLACSLTGFTFAWALYRFQLLDLAPVARATLIEQLNDGVIVVDTRSRIVDINPAAQQLLSLSQGQWIGETAETILLPYNRLPTNAASGSALEFVLSDEPLRYAELRVSQLFDKKKVLTGQLLVLRDITRRKNAELEVQAANQRLQEQLNEINLLRDQMREQAIRDVVTGLFNRRYLEETLPRELSRARREEYAVSILMIDIDQFKHLNDEYGHKAGDLVLRKVGDLLTQRTRREDMACRYGGDEIIVVLPRARMENAYRRAEEMRIEFANLRPPFFGKELQATFSIGVAMFPQQGSTTEDITHTADLALYQAKSQGGNCTVMSSAGNL